MHDRPPSCKSCRHDLAHTWKKNWRRTSVSNVVAACGLSPVSLSVSPPHPHRLSLHSYQFPSERTSCVPISYVVSSRKRDETGTTGMRMASLPRHSSLGGSRESLVHWRLSSSSLSSIRLPRKPSIASAAAGLLGDSCCVCTRETRAGTVTARTHRSRTVPSRPEGEGTGRGTRSSVPLSLSLLLSVRPSLSLSPKPRKDRRRGSNERARSLVARARVFFPSNTLSRPPVRYAIFYVNT